MTISILIKFVVLRPIRTEHVAEVALQLMDIFPLMGTLVIHQSENSSEFTPTFVTERKEVWPSLHLIHS